MPSAHAAELTEQKGIYIMKNVVGLDLANYTVTAKETMPSQQSSYLGVVPQDTVAYNLTSGGSMVNALCTFANGSLQMIYVFQNQGSPYLTNTATTSNDVDAAKGFLTSYQTYTGEPLFGELKSTLDNVNSSKNTTLTYADKVLEVNASSGNTNFKWYYSANGAIAPYSKFISLGFNNGSLASFVDNWDLYNVGSTSVNLSKEQAVQIALATARNHTWSIPLDNDTLAPQNFNEAKSVSWSALIFDDSIGANANRSSDQLELYPVWRIGIVLNKWYGQMYGIEVDVWADNGQVRSVQEAYSTLPPPADVSTANPNGQTLVTSQAMPSMALVILLPVIALAVPGTAYFWLRKKELHGYSLLNRHVRTGGILLCILISSTVVLGVLSTVSATTRGTYVWGARSSGAIKIQNDPNSFSWRKTDSERAWQQQTSMYITYYFANNGYNAYDHEGINSQKSQIITDLASTYQDNYWAIVDFDHGVYGFPPNGGGESHYMLEDDTGTEIGTYNNWSTNWSHGVYDMDIYSYTSGSRVTFAFINTCLSADITTLGQGSNVYSSGNAVGMPYAFTHRIVEAKSTQGFNIGQDISIDGYGNPDTGSQVYIGFPWGSAALEQNIPYNYGYQYNSWVIAFFYTALYYGISVNQALDWASNQAWGTTFGNSPLRQGFTSCWPEMDQWGSWTNYYGFGSTMAVYGNGNIFLRNYEPNYVSTPTIGADTDLGVTYTYYNFWASSISPSGHQIRYVFDWGDNSSQTSTGWCTSGATAYESHYWASAGLYTVTVTAESDDGVWSNPSHYTVNIQSPVYHMLTVGAYGAYFGNTLNPDVYIDDVNYGPAPVSIQVTEGYHYVSVDTYTWDPYWNCMASLNYMYNYYTSTIYYNGQPVPITSDTWIAASYIP